jgi:hypothetical protein
MAVPSYTTDLQTVNLSTGTWGEFTGATAGSSPTENDADNFIAGTDSTTEGTRSGGLCSMYAPANTVGITAGDAVFFWFYHGAMPTVDLFANDGYQACIGSGTAAYNRYTVAGRDTLPKGGWFNVAVDPTATPTNVQGTSSAVTTYFGSRINMSGSVSKGNPYANDFIRYGRSCISDLGEIANPATFDGMATENDLVANKWGLFEKVDSGYSQKGLYQMGTVTNAVYFEDSNKSILIEDTLHVAVGFNEFEVLNTGSTVKWTGIQITALGTQSKGKFTVTDNAAVTKVSCTFNDMDTFVYQSNSDITDTIYRRCGLVTVGTATFTTCSFLESTATAATLTAALADLGACTFVSDGTGHAVELTSVGAGSMGWNGKLTGYAGSDGSTGNEAIFVNVGSGTLTINVAEGADTPYIKTAGAVVTVISGGVTIDVNVKNEAGSPIENAYVYIDEDLGTAGEISNVLTNASGNIVQASYTGVATSATVRIRLYGYKPFLGSITLLQNSATNVILILDPQQS